VPPTEPRAIDWESAEIEDGELTVGLTGQKSKDWRARFENVLALLDTPHTAWGEVTLVKDRIVVAGVEQGSESDLRHFLESIVIQANADTRRGEEETEPQDAPDKPDPDAEMTRAFRAFAAEQG
jgi:hypothetical protein